MRTKHKEAVLFIIELGRISEVSGRSRLALYLE